MRKILIAVIFILGTIQPAWTAAKTLPSQIKTVTLFSNQALIHREASGSVQSGLNEIRIAIETFHIDPESVTAKVFGIGEVYSVQYKTLPVKEPPQGKIRILEEKLQKLMRSRQKMTDEKNTLKKQELFLDSFIDFSQTQIPKELATRLPRPEELNQTLSFLKANYQKLYSQAQTIDVNIKNLDKDIKVVKRELDAVRGSSRKSLGVIEILFRSNKEQEIRVEAQYLTGNARWQPLYKVAVPSALAEMDLTMFSKIAQKTGEDWRRVDLVVSTVIPLRGVGLPELNSWLLDLPRPAIAGMARDRAAVMKKSAPPAPMEEGIAAEAEPLQPEASFVQSQRREQPLAFEYTIPRPINIDSRHKDTLLPLFTKKLRGDFFHYSVPKQSALTFLVARVQSDKELLSGMLNVYFSGQYVGKTFLSSKRAGETFDISLGADREVMVKREKIHDKARETYFGKFERDTVVRELKYKITVENLKNRPVTLKILDHIPVSRTDRIEVKDLKLTPTPTRKDIQDRKGVMLWEQKLKPGAKNQITIEFVATYPKEFPPPF